MREDLWTAAGRRVVSSRDAERLGLDARVLRRAATDGRLVRVRRDAYVDGTRWGRASGADRHLVRVSAAARALPDAVFSHESAAAVWGLPVLGGFPQSVRVVGAYRGGGRRLSGVVHRSSTLAVESQTRAGVRVTTCARTVVDLARERPFATALAAADHALRTDRVTKDELTVLVETLGRRRGVRAAQHAVAHASGLAESPGESLSRARMIEIGLMTPVLQAEMRDSRGLVGRVDFWWPSLGLVGEFDGRVKYRPDGVDDGRCPEDRLWDEKLREDRLRAAGSRVVRWTWDDAWDVDRFADVMRRAGVPLAR